MTALIRLLNAESPERARDLRILLLTFMAFIILGMNAGLLGVAVPSIRGEFGLPLDAASLPLIVTQITYTLSSFASGPLIFRMGYGRYFLLGGALGMLGIFSYVIAPQWLLVLLAGLITGMGSGLIDAGMNNYVATHHGARAMNWLHACFGIGISLSPLIMTAVLSNELSWRAGYGIVGGLNVVFVLLLVLALGSWKRVPHITAVDHNPLDGKAAQRPSLARTLALPAVWISLAWFTIYVGIEATPGQWAYSFFTESRGVETTLAGILASLYWTSFTVGRVIFSLIILRIQNTTRLLRLCMFLAALGAGLWWLRIDIVSFAGLLLLGFAQAPMFAIFISNTSRYVGREHAQNAIGIQVGGVGIGAALVPGLAGVLAERTSLEILAPMLLVACLIMIGLFETLERYSNSTSRPVRADS